MKIPWWVNLLAKLYPFRFCAECVEKVQDGEELPKGSWFTLIKHWALDGCVVCGRRRTHGKT